MKKARIDKEKCIGCGTCMVICPKAFELGEDGKAKVLKLQGSELPECAKEAVDSCPVEAIELAD